MVKLELKSRAAVFLALHDHRSHFSRVDRQAAWDITGCNVH